MLYLNEKLNNVSFNKELGIEVVSTTEIVREVILTSLKFKVSYLEIIGVSAGETLNFKLYLFKDKSSLMKTLELAIKNKQKLVIISLVEDDNPDLYYVRAIE